MVDDPESAPNGDETDIERRRFLRSAGAAAGGAVLAGSVPTASAGRAGPTPLERSRYPCQHGFAYTLETSGNLSEGGQWTHTHQLESNVCTTTISLDSSESDDRNDFDLYVTLDGRTATESDYDRKSTSRGTAEEVHLKQEDTYGDQELGLMVKSRVGGGDFEVQVLEDLNVTPGDDPTASTDATSEISDTTATLNGSLDDLGDADEVDAFFEYREEGSADPWRTTGKEELTSAGSFAQFVPGLEEDTAYEFRAIVASAELNRTDRGSIRLFTTDGGGWCFITTATHRRGKTLDSLRRFRDESMAATPVGRGLAGLYYRISPPIARTLERHPESRTASAVRRLVRACASLSDRQAATDSRAESVALGVGLTALYTVGIAAAAAGHAGISVLELLGRA